MTQAYLSVVYPAVLVAGAVLLLAGAATLLTMRVHRALTWVVTGMYIVTVAEVVVVIGAMLGGDVPVVITTGYVLAALALLPLLGIGRLGTPEAAKDDPGRPVLHPDQIAKVDAVAAILVAIAAAVVAWRIAVILHGA